MRAPAVFHDRVQAVRSFDVTDGEDGVVEVVDSGLALRVGVVTCEEGSEELVSL